MKRVLVGDFQLGVEEKKAINEVLDLGRLSEGKKTREFEIEFAKYIGTKYCVALSSGTSALIAGLLALIHDRKSNVKRSSKVITSPLTYVATVNALVLTYPLIVKVRRPNINQMNFLNTVVNHYDLIKKFEKKPQIFGFSPMYGFYPHDWRYVCLSIFVYERKNKD